MNIKTVMTNTFNGFLVAPKATNRRLEGVPCDYCVHRKKCPSPDYLSKYCKDADVFEQSYYPHEDEEVYPQKIFYPSFSVLGIGQNFDRKGKLVDIKVRQMLPFSTQEMKVFIDGPREKLPAVTQNNIKAALDYIGKKEFGHPKLSEDIKSLPIGMD